MINSNCPTSKVASLRQFDLHPSKYKQTAVNARRFATSDGYLVKARRDSPFLDSVS